MGRLLSYLLFGFAVISMYISVQEAVRETADLKNKCLFVGYQVGSSIWSLFFGLLLTEMDTDIAATLRTLGMVGMFSYLIFATLLMSSWAKLAGKMKLWIEGFAYLGIPLYPFTVSREHITFKISRFGMSYEFAPGFWSYAYTAYTVIVAVNLFVIIFHITNKSSKKREKVMGKKLVICEIIIIIGMVMDTIMPQFGFTAFPGSSISQFLGAVILYKVYLLYYRSQITLDNMSEFVYYSVNEPVLIYDEERKLRIVSNSATEFFGESVKENGHKMLSQIFDVSEDVFDRKEKCIQVEVKCLCNDSFCRLGIDKITDKYGDVLGYIIVVDDMTDKIRNMKELKEARRKADEANEAKSRFLANMSHEIRTPINAVLGMDEMILRESDSPEVLEYAGNIRNAGKTLLAIINDILDFSKIESGMMEIVESKYAIGEVLTELTGEISLRAEKQGLRLITEFDPKLPSKLYGDEVRIRQIVLNILTNAVKYTKEGSILFHVSFTEQSDHQILLDIFIKDTGIGIKEENIPKLFDSFQRVNESLVHNIEGTGLGLSIVKRLLDLMEGTLEVKSLFGVGSIFYVHIPQKVVSYEPLGSLAEKVQQRKLKKYEASFMAPDAKILVVDDYKLNLQVLQGLLKKTGIQLTLVESGKECLQRVRQQKYDMIFLDHMMPEMDGIETLRRMRELKGNLNKETPVIALTANALAGAKEMYLQEGFADYLSKPIDSVLLETMIKQYLPDRLLHQGSQFDRNSEKGERKIEEE